MNRDPLFATGLLGVALAALSIGAACGDKDVGDSGTTGGTTMTSATWDEVETNLANSCAFSSCHGGGTYPKLGEGDAYDALVGMESIAVDGAILVVPGDADASYLVKKIQGAADIEGEPMPKGSDKWDNANIAKVRAWIDAGALAD